MQKKYNKSSISRSLSAVRSFYKFFALEAEDVSILNIINVIDPVKTNKLLPKSFNIAEVTEVLEMISEINEGKEQWIIQRDYVIILLLYGLGLRISEALTISQNHIVGNYLLVQGKGKKERLLPLMPEIKIELNKYIDLCPFLLKKDDIIFRGLRGKVLQSRVIRSLVEKIRTVLNLPDSFTPHALRHSFATHLFAECQNIRHIQTLLGHEKITSTEIYTKVEKELLIQQYNKFHPKSSSE